MKKILLYTYIISFFLLLSGCGVKNEPLVSHGSNGIISDLTTTITKIDEEIRMENTLLDNVSIESIYTKDGSKALISTDDNSFDFTSKKQELSEGLLGIRDISSIDLVKEMSVGWNLGNTLDALGEGLESELAWNNPFTSKENIDKVKEAGFNVLRIPTTWENHLTSSVSYTIDPNWLERVKEVVDYGIDNDMFVILNSHHDEWYYPSYKNLTDGKEILISIWSQIGNYFKDYDEHLIFEGFNEPRMKGSEYEWTEGTVESRDVINEFNMTFIHTIRNLEGNNNKRHLMIAPYAASSKKDAWNDFIIPNDNKIIVSIHGYEPYNFALNQEGSDTFDPTLATDTESIDHLLDNLEAHFLQNNAPVILGELGALDKNNIKDRIAWTNYYINRAKEKGIPCIWWDNGSFIGDGENFGLLDRRNNTWVFEGIVEALTKDLHHDTNEAKSDDDNFIQSSDTDNALSHK